jgi:hypothetical protein
MGSVLLLLLLFSKNPSACGVGHNYEDAQKEPDLVM